MGATLLKNVWLSTDSVFALQLCDDLGPVDLSPAIRMKLFVGKKKVCDISLNDSDKPVDWVGQTEVGKVTFKLGALLVTEEIAPGIYPMELHVFDTADPEGIVWFSNSLGEVRVRVHPDLDP